ncbi:hypothetical protein EDD17DRAFT_1505627 [Pisolithus thermaeus]|nr:hypothetical protein EDD17DRAFT_1505627 [Pisolithus thermaeus]
MSRAKSNRDGAPITAQGHHAQANQAMSQGRVRSQGDAVIYSTEIRVRTSQFEVYYDQEQHLHDHGNAVYVFVALASSGRPINICPEDDLPAIIEALQLDEATAQEATRRRTPRQAIKESQQNHWK